MAKSENNAAKQRESKSDPGNAKAPHPGGRPTKYTPDMIDRLEGYMRNCQDDLPSKAGFAIFVGVHVNTMDNWGRKYPEFLWALERLKTLQCSILIDKGLKGAYNPTITKLLLINNHGFGKRRDTVTDDKHFGAVTVSAECVH
ncbi:MAG: terminase small subunit [Sedimentisphaerales bacterium]